MKGRENNLFYRGISTKEEAGQFDAGYNMAKDKIKDHSSGLKAAYNKALKLSEKDLDSLNPAQRGYISKVVDTMLTKRGKALDAYNICLNTGVIYDIPNNEIKENLIRDAASSKSSLKYMNEIQSFMKENDLKVGSLEMMVQEAIKRKTGAFKKINKTSIFLVLAGFLFSGYNITGNVIGTTVSSGKLVGALLFSVGLIWMTVSIKKETAKII